MRGLGFTLVELVVVIILLGILAAVFIPRSGNDAIILSTQAEQFAADIRYVQSLSMTQGKRYRVNFTATGYTFTDTGNNPVPHSSGTTGAIAFAGGVSISPFPVAVFSFVAPNNVVSFDGRGIPYTDANAANLLAATATLSMVRGSATRTIQIFQNTGMVRVP